MTTNIRLIDVSWSGGIVAVAASLLAVVSYRLDRKAMRDRKFS
ncbi:MULTISPECIES: hypothetical protein [unclassified Brevibacillus]|nr:MULTISPECIES: hypothetical protein [unclassified Brevibacillus]